MIKSKGYFLLHRSIWSNPTVMKDLDYFVVWIYILSQVEYEAGRVVDFGGDKITLKAGQMTIGINNQMFSDLKTILPGLTQSKLYRILQCYSDAKQIEKQRSARCSLITVVNWDKYQKNAKQIAKQMTTKEINKEVYKAPHTKVGEQQTNGIRVDADGCVSAEDAMKAYLLMKEGQENGATT